MAHLLDGGNAAGLANHLDMQQASPFSPLLAARQALAEQQIRALREWLGEGHELLKARAGPWAQAAPEVESTRRVGQPPISEEVSA